jgi:antitoxin VapB
MYTRYVYPFQEAPTMTYARVFQSGNSQAVRLPKEFRLEVDRVEIFRRGDEIILREKPASAALIFDILASFPTDFMEDGRDDTPPQEREDF